MNDCRDGPPWPPQREDLCAIETGKSVKEVVEEEKKVGSGDGKK